MPFIEESPSGFTVNGASTTQNTAQKKFGVASRRMFTGSASVSHDPAHNFGTGAFTMETWVRWFLAPSPGNKDYLITKWWAGTNNREWVWILENGNMRFWWSTDGLDLNLSNTGAFAPTAGTWHHLAVDYDGTNLRLYADGTMLSKTTAAISMFAGTCNMLFGARFDDRGDFDELLDETRIIKGAAVYGSDAGYTVPTAAFPRP